MRRVTLLLMGLVLLLGTVAAMSELAVPRHTGWVVDNAKLFSSAEEQQIASMLQRLKSVEQGAQMAVLTVPSLEGDALELFSIRVVDAWKLGKKDVDNGLLLLIARDDRKMRFEVGYGLEGRLTDARCGDIIRALQPYFRAQRYADGVRFAVGSVQEQLTGIRPSDMPSVPVGVSKKKKPDVLFLLVIFFFVVLPLIRQVRYGRGHTIFLGGGYRGGGHRGGGFGGGGFSGGGFSGGGGSFGGGGASGSW